MIDGLTILLKDKKIIRLSSLEMPGRGSEKGQMHEAAARQALADLLPAGTNVTIFQTRDPKKGRMNRMGHQLAHLVKKDKPKDGVETPAQLWINGWMAQQGWALVMPSDFNPELTAELYAQESLARQHQTGLWAPDQWPVLTPEQALSVNGELRVVEGIVTGAGSSHNNTFLNFGPDWKTDFTVMISPSLRRDLSHKGVDVLGLTHHTVRARGFVRPYNGTVIELENPAHLEVLQ